MRPEPRQTLADNLRRIIGPDSNPTRWAAERRIDKKVVQRALNGKHATTIDTIEEIARACGLLPWQLLLPGLDPANPPVITMTRAERDLYRRLRDTFAALPPLTNGH